MKKIYMVFLCFCFVAGILFIYLSRTVYSHHPGIIIVLNGPSCSGKSSIQKELQALSHKPVLKMGLDSLFVAVIPEKYILGITPDAHSVLEGVASHDDKENPVFSLKIGTEGEKIISGMHHAIADYARAGNTIVVDYILYNHKWLEDVKKIWKGIPVYWIGIQSDLKEIERREKMRGTSPQGHARSHYYTVHEGCIYDFVIDVTHKEPKESAQAILNYIHEHPKEK